MNTDNGNIDLEVTNFGPIVEAKINLRPLTIFVGPSNTGKSYLAILIYALHRFFDQGANFLSPDYRRRFSIWQRFMSSRKLSNNTMEGIIELARSLTKENKISPSNSTIVLPESVAKFIQSSLNKNNDGLACEIIRCFGISEIKSLTRKQSQCAARIVTRRRMLPESYPLENTLKFTQQNKFNMIVPNGVPIPIEINGNSRSDRNLYKIAEIVESLNIKNNDRGSNKFALIDFMDSIVGKILPSLLGSLHLPAYYLPADRTGIMHAHNVVVSALITAATSAGIRPTSKTPMLTGVLADFMDQLIELSYERKRIKKDLAIDIEKHMLGGSVHIQEDAINNYPHFVYRPNNWQSNLALANASSMVSELAPIVLYLRHIVVSGNVLIVEEPESHLHPAMQVEFIRQLSVLVNKGIRIIVTTHSEWLLEELANIVRRSELPESELKRGANHDVKLRPDQVGTWLFEMKNRPKGTKVKQILLDDSGLYPSGYDEIAIDLHNDWAKITGLLQATP